MHSVKHKTIALLRWSEKYTRTDMTYLAKGSFWLLFTQGVAFIFSFGLLWVFTNNLSKEVYGEFRFVTTAASILTLFALPGLAASLIRSVARGDLGTLTVAIKQKIYWGLIGSFFAALGSGYYFLQSDIRLGVLFLIIAIVVPLLEAYTLYSHYLNGLKDFRMYAVTRNINRAAVVSCTAAAVFLSGDIILIVLTYFLSNILIEKILLLWTLKRYPVNGSIDDSAFSYGKHLSVMAALRLGAQYLDKVVLWYLAGPAQVAIYTVAMALPQELATGMGQISKLALPKMSSRSPSEIKTSLVRKTFIYLLCSVPLVLVYIYSAPFIFNTFFPEYAESIFFSQVASLLIPLVAAGLLFQYFVATTNTRVQYTMSILEPIVLLTAYAALIPWLGLLGAVCAILLKQTISFCYLLFEVIFEKPMPAN